MTAIEACHAAARGFRSVDPEAEVLLTPMSDGGEGLVACLSQVLQLQPRTVEVHGPLGDLVTAHYALSTDGRTAYLEMAEAAGLCLVPTEKRNPLLTTTYGVGEMLLDAVHHGCEQIVMGIGGSATCDGGKGMVECLKELGWNGGCSVVVASDVTNPLCGAQGAARVFAPQKGATPEQVELLEQRLRDFALSTAAAGIAPVELMGHPGAGAAGGLGYGLMAYLGATLQSGIDLVLDTMDFDRLIADADLIVTGEGKSDKQTLMGKVAAGVLTRALRQGIPCHLLSGQIEEREALLKAGFASVRSVHEGDCRPLSVLMRQEVTEENIYRQCRKIANIGRFYSF